MKCLSRSMVLTACLAFNAAYVYAAPDVSGLVKVTNESSANCVEYYNYRGEMYCSTAAQSTQAVDPDIYKQETQVITFDDRAWQPAWGDKSETVITIEYVPMGDNIEHWNELVTSQFFPGLEDKITPREFAEAQIQRLKDSGFDPIVTFIESLPDTVIFEYRIESPSNQAQDELQKITKGKDGLYALHYVIKKGDMGPENRKIWSDNLARSTLN